MDDYMLHLPIVGRKRNPVLHSMWLLCCVVLVSGCVSYEPRQLVPNITLSPEDLQLAAPTSPEGNAAGVDYGLTVTVNESDSLFNLEVLPGVRVQEVTPSGPAELAGIRAGDVILSINGTELNHPDTFAALALAGQQSVALFQVRRGTAVLEASVIGRARAVAGAPLRELHRTDPLATRASYDTAVLQDRIRGTVTAARVVELADDSPLHSADIQPDDIILALQGQEIQSAQNLIDRLINEHELGSSVELSIYRDSQILERRVSLWDPGRRISRVALRPLAYYESSLANQQTRFSLLDFWLFSVYRYERSESEREHRLLEIFGFSSAYGELVEESPAR